MATTTGQSSQSILVNQSSRKLSVRRSWPTEMQ